MERITSGTIDLSFLVANTEGYRIELQGVDLACPVAHLKELVLDAAGRVDSVAQFRLVCMGQLWRDNSILSDYGVPYFKRHPTPVHITTCPGKAANGAAGSSRGASSGGGATGGASAGGAGAGGGAGSTAQSAGGAQANEAPAGCRCSIM